jgi:hypothetical protein
MVFVLLNSIFILLKYKDFSANIVKNNFLKKIPLKLLLLQRNEVKNDKQFNTNHTNPYNQ